jgi:osmotically-inducible protein OsmY
MMKLLKSAAWVVPAAFLLAVAVAGCSQQTISSANSDANHDIAVANQKANQAVQKVKPALASLDLGTRVTAAIEANQNLPHDSIRVDSNPNGVRLKGHVSTAAQKKLAGQVAKDTLGPGKSVDNELKVG